MRVKILTALVLCILSSVGCRFMGGKCDCVAAPGDASLYSGFQGYRQYNAPSAPTSGTSMPMGENVGAPKTMGK